MRHSMLTVLAALLFTTTAGATTYYVDHDHGDDTNAGTTQATAWKHCPGDSAATAQPRAVKLAPGDTVRLKAGVVYRGSISVGTSGTPGKPITYDGGASDGWGTGRAIIEGSVPLTGLKRCANAAEAEGNPNFRNIYWTTVPKGANWKTINLCQGLTPLAWSQNPNPADPILQENPREYFKTDPHVPVTNTNIDVKPIGMGTNGGRPLIAMFDQSRLSAVIENLSGGALEVTLDKPVTVTSFAVTPQARYCTPKQMSFHVDGKQVLKVDLAHNPTKTVEQKFALDKPLTFRKLTVKFLAAYPNHNGETRNWGAVQRIAAYDAAGTNVLLADRRTTLRHDKAFTQDDAAHYNNAFLALYARPAMVYYRRIIDYDPENRTIEVEALTHRQQPYGPDHGAFAIVNNPRFIDQPGEYALMLDPLPDGSHKLLLWPPNGKPEGITRGRYGVGINVRASHIALRSLWVRKQGWGGSAGIEARGRGTDLVIDHCKVTNLRGSGAGIHTTQIDNVLVDRCEVSDNAGHTKGILLRNAKNIVTRRCTLRKNSSTALDYYTVTNGVVQDCTVIDNTGMHANGLTFYVGCRDILVERNLVRDGNAGLTVQDGENMIIRNNIIEGSRGGSPAIGLWSGKPFNNIVMIHNVFRHHGDPRGWSAAIYGGNGGAHGYAIVNNIIDGFSGNVLQKASFHHNIFTKLGPTLPAARLGENKLVEDLDAIFMDAAKGDYRLKADSPAISAGVKVATLNQEDRAGVGRPFSGGYDVGPYEYHNSHMARQPKPTLADPHTFKFSFDGYTIAPPPPFKMVYEMKFIKRDDAGTITQKGIDFTGQEGGKVNLRPTRGGYISGWDDAGHWLEWTVTVPIPGAYELAIEHASEMPSKRQVLLNGKPVKGLEAVPFPATGAWRTFMKSGLPVRLNLAKGKNSIRFVNVAGSLNFKVLEFIPVKAD